ncbi:MAG: hypothetical protein AAF152_12640 [Cyanobacteria bacterium P01_A01_bin.114]
MARYTNFLMTVTPANSLRQALASVLEACGLNLIYEASDYIVAKEKPGNVSYSQLATVEVLISSTVTQEPSSTINLVVKNEELPLKINNHCQQVFEQVNEAIANASH